MFSFHRTFIDPVSLRSSVFFLHQTSPTCSRGPMQPARGPKFVEPPSLISGRWRGVPRATDEAASPGPLNVGQPSGHRRTNGPSWRSASPPPPEDPTRGIGLPQPAGAGRASVPTGAGCRDADVSTSTPADGSHSCGLKGNCSPSANTYFLLILSRILA